VECLVVLPALALHCATCRSVTESDVVYCTVFYRVCLFKKIRNFPSATNVVLLLLLVVVGVNRFLIP